MAKPKSKGLPWIAAEEDFLRAHFGTAPAKFVALRLGRTTAATRSRAAKLRLTCNSSPGKPRLPSWPPASKACLLVKGARVINRTKRNEYILEGPVRIERPVEPGAQSVVWVLADRVVCHSNPRAPVYRSWLKADGLTLIQEYREWYAEVHAGCKPPAPPARAVRGELARRLEFQDKYRSRAALKPRANKGRQNESSETCQIPQG